MSVARARCFPSKKVRMWRRTWKWKDLPGLMRAGSPAALQAVGSGGKGGLGGSRCILGAMVRGAALGSSSSSWLRGLVAEPTFPITAGPFPGLFPGLRRRCSARAGAAGLLPALPAPRLGWRGRSGWVAGPQEPQAGERAAASAVPARIPLDSSTRAGFAPPARRRGVKPPCAARQRRWLT